MERDFFLAVATPFNTLIQKFAKCVGPARVLRGWCGRLRGVAGRLRKAGGVLRKGAGVAASVREVAAKFLKHPARVVLRLPVVSGSMRPDVPETLQKELSNVARFE